MSPPTAAPHARAPRNRSAGGTAGSLGGSERDALTASLTASYEIDFWGKNRSALRAAEETAVASRYDREVVGLTTVVATANAYFQVLAAQDRLRVARENIASATRMLNLIQQQFAAGTASAARHRPAGKPCSTPSARRSRRWSRR